MMNCIYKYIPSCYERETTWDEERLWGRNATIPSSLYFSKNQTLNLLKENYFTGGLARWLEDEMKITLVNVEFKKFN